MIKSAMIIALTASALSIGACSFLGGPSDKQIEDLARNEMIRNAGPGDAASQAAMKSAALGATISKKGLCNHTPDDTYACMANVTVKLPGAAAESLIRKLLGNTSML